MMKTLRLSAALLALCLGSVSAQAVTKTATWTWPTTRTDGSTLALTSIGGMTLWDTSVPNPNQPGTAVACPVTPLPPTTATGTCSANVTAGHSFVITIQDNSTPADQSAISNSVTIPFAAPSAVTNFTLQ